jgi:uncharacterized protein YbcI
MNTWKEELEKYEDKIKDKILSEEDIMLDLENKLSPADDFLNNMRRHHMIRRASARLAKYKPYFVESVDKFTDMPKVDKIKDL